MGWSDYTTENNTALTTKFNFMQCLTLAYNERAEFAGITQLPEVKRLSANPANFCQSFDASLDSLIPHFGKIVSGAYVAYTVTSIYEELEETRLDSRLPAYKLNPIYYRLWFEQVIRVINKLVFCNILNTIDIREIDGVRPHGIQSTGTQVGAYFSSSTFEGAVNGAWGQANSEFNTNITTYELIDSYFSISISNFTGTSGVDSWRAGASHSARCVRFNYAGNNLINTGTQFLARWILAASGRTRKLLTEELLGVSNLQELYHTPLFDYYSCDIVYIADVDGYVLANLPWDSFDFPFQLETSEMDGFAESRLDGYADTYYGGNFEFVAGS